jgi:hypothetical protein
MRNSAEFEDRAAIDESLPLEWLSNLNFDSAEA